MVLHVLYVKATERFCHKIGRIGHIRSMSSQIIPKLAGLHLVTCRTWSTSASGCVPSKTSGPFRGLKRIPWCFLDADNCRSCKAQQETLDRLIATEIPRLMAMVGGVSASELGQKVQVMPPHATHQIQMHAAALRCGPWHARPMASPALSHGAAPSYVPLLAAALSVSPAFPNALSA